MAHEERKPDNINEKINGWLDKNREAFGGRILCVDLDLRIATHLAHLFPGASIAVLTKEKPADADTGPGLPLVIETSLEEYDGGLFDTIVSFSSAPLCPAFSEKNNAQETASAPGQEDKAYPVTRRGTLYLYRASLLMEYYEKTAGLLRRHLREGGTLLSLVPSEHDEHLLGYSLALAAEGMQVSPAIRQILCRSKGKRVTLQALKAIAGGSTQITSLIAENLNFNLDRMDTGAEELEGKEAEILLQADLSGLVRGYHLYQGDKFMGKLAVYTSALRPDVLYYFTDVEGDVPYLRRFHTEDRQKLIRHMVGEMHRLKASDKQVRWQELVLNDDWSETEL